MKMKRKRSFGSQESEHQELLRSERVLGALRQAQQSLQQREKELLENCERLRQEVANDPRVSACVALEHEIEEHLSRSHLDTLPNEIRVYIYNYI